MTKSVFSNRYQILLTELVEARRLAGITQVELARKLKKPQSYISKVERGERRLDVIEFLDLAEAIGLEPDSVIRRFHQRS